MNKQECEALRLMKERIDAGEDPETVIPYHLDLPDDAMLEVCYYAIQVLPDGRRKNAILKYMEEHNAVR